MVKFNFTTRNKIICLTLIFFLVFNMSTPISIVFANTTLSKEDSKSLEYALFAADNLTLNNFSTIVNGNIYTGDDLNYTGEKPVTINGYGNLNGKYDETKINSLKEIKDDKEKIVDFEDEVISKLKNTENYDEDTVFLQDIIDVSKDINVDGNLHIDRSTLNGTGYILAKHNIIYDAINDKVNDYNVFMYSEDGNITISGSNIVINGVIAAPKGKIIINAKNIEINGSIYGESIELNGSNLIVNDNSSSITENFFDPNLDILTEGELKENRKVTLDISENEDISLVEEDSISWSILPLNIEDGELYNEMYQGIKIDEDTSNDNVKNLIFKKAGKYLVNINYSTKKKN